MTPLKRFIEYEKLRYTFIIETQEKDMNLKNVYNNALYERYNHPKYKVTLNDPCLMSGVYNPSCGDKISVQIKYQEGKIIAVGYEAQGCVISGGSADLILEYALGKTAQEIMILNNEHVFAIIGMSLGPNRLRCAFITVEALKNICVNL